MEEVEEYYEESQEVENKLFQLEKLEQGPSRSEQLYGSDWKKKVLNKNDLPVPDVMYVNCPRHGDFLMTPIKIFRSAYGVSVTFQCHHIDKYDHACLIIVQVNEPISGSRPWLRSGDLLAHEQWDKALEKVQQVNFGDRIIATTNEDLDMSNVSSDLTFTEVPPNPWTKQGSVSYIIWDVFWKNIQEQGFCTYKAIEDAMMERKGEIPKQTYQDTLGSVPLTNWMMLRTGFVIKKFGESWKVVARGEGAPTSKPWSDPEYRKKFGFE